ncbi:3,4-dihydroxy-2-butanone-4-phosphate synthase [bacterium]|nr:3,4-dihydroxy-2-butanone-4-phosphate synthase [bacterium]
MKNAVRAIQDGRIVVVVDDENRENEGDLVCAAVHATPENVNFMIKEARGLLCVPMLAERLDALGIPQMGRRNMDPLGTAFTVSVDGVEGITTGISARERSRTILKLVDPSAQVRDLRQPGHVFPLRADKGGVLARAGHTEASIDLCDLAGLPQAAVICEVLRDDGEMMRMKGLKEFAKTHQLPLLTIADLIEHLLVNRPTIHLHHEAKMEGAMMRVLLFSDYTGATHTAFVAGNPQPNSPCLVRVHSERSSQDDSDRDSRLQQGIDRIAAEGEGVVVLLGMNHPLAQNGGENKMDFRAYGLGAQILRGCGVGKMRVLTNNARNIVALEGFGLEIVETLPMDHL